MPPQNRPKMPASIEFKVLYRSARTCCVCRKKERPIHIHHIDKKPANNSEENLVVLCTICHDEAHTDHKLSKNLTSAKLRTFKKEWEEQVQQSSSRAMLPSSNLNQAIWTYINYERLPDMMNACGVNFDKDLLKLLKKRNVVDAYGIPITKKIKKDTGTGLLTIYDHFSWDDGRRLHSLYRDAVDRIIMSVHPLELGSIWSKREIKTLVDPGAICYCMRGFYFKPRERANNEEIRDVYARSKKISIMMSVNTRHMYGNSSLCDAFCAHRIAAVLFLARDLSDVNGDLRIRGTPIAMGMGFVPFYYMTPHKLRYRWAEGMRM
jgi:hypothetical protein